MARYRFEVRDVSTLPPRLVDEWFMELADDDAARREVREVLLSPRRQVLVFRDGETTAFGSRVSDDLADAMEA